MTNLLNIEEDPEELPWYKDGLRFDCNQCGKCCTGPSGWVWVTYDEMKAMATLLNISLELFIRKYTRQRDNRYALTERKNINGDYDCVFLKERKCQIYQARPKQCRTYPWWSENLRTPESWGTAAQHCEGIHDEAPLIPYEQIVQLNR